MELVSLFFRFLRFNVVGYATYEEGLDAVKSTGDFSQRQKLVLDVFTHKNVKAQVETEGLRPVLVKSFVRDPLPAYF